MPKTPKQFEDMRTERRASILEAALHVFAEEGYHSASISKVSKYAKISKGLLYNYFESKEDLLKILLGSLIDDEIKMLNSFLEKSLTEESFIHLINDSVKTIKEHPKQWKLYFAMSFQDEVQEIMKDKHSPTQALFAERFIQFFKDKSHENPLQQMQYFMTFFTGMKNSYIMQPKTYPIEEMKQLMIKQFITS